MNLFEPLLAERWLYVSPNASELDLVILGTSMLTLVHAALQRRLLWLAGLFLVGLTLEQAAIRLTGASAQPNDSPARRPVKTRATSAPSGTDRTASPSRKDPTATRRRSS